MAEQNDNTAALDTRPRVFFKSISFQNGTKINFGNNDIVVFVGGNNAGKSQILKDLKAQLKGATQDIKILQNINIKKYGSFETLSEFLENSSFTKKEPFQISYSGLGYSFGYMHDTMQYEWAREDNIGSLASFFCRHIQTENRIKDSNNSVSFDAIHEAPSNPVQYLYKDTAAEKRVSSYFQKAFDKELIVYKTGGSKIPLLVGERINSKEGEEATDSSYAERLLAQTEELEQQGDGMRSFASVILQTLADPIPSILLLDEPEAFLHPPQAKILGRLLAKKRPRDAQLFIATHSVDILMGLLEAAPENLHIIRLNRDSDKYAVELNKDKAEEIMRTPFLRHSKILSGLFYKRVIVCEAEADCLFYQIILENMGVAGISDTLFIPAGGKDKLYKLASILRTLHIPVDVIADLDILNDGGGTFEKTIKTLGNEQAWTKIAPLWNSVKSAIEGQRSLKTAEEVEQDIQSALKKLKNKKASFPADIDKEIRAALKNSSPWGYTKTAGIGAIPRGEARQDWQKLQKACARINLWLVPVGELESFCPASEGHGSDWVHNVLEKDLSAKEFDEARQFIAFVWDNRPDDLN